MKEFTEPEIHKEGEYSTFELVETQRTLDNSELTPKDLEMIGIYTHEEMQKERDIRAKLWMVEENGEKWVRGVYYWMTGVGYQIIQKSIQFKASVSLEVALKTFREGLDYLIQYRRDHPELVWSNNSDKPYPGTKSEDNSDGT